MEISTSLLNVEENKIVQTIYDLEVAHTDYFHIDVMDGRFVSNDTSEKMRRFAEYLNQITNIPMDVHLMVTNIKEYIDSYLIFNPNIISFHYETCKNSEEVYKFINYIKDNNCKVGLAIKPETKIKKIEKFLSNINMLLIMSVEPGKGGQKFIDNTINKIREAKNIIDKLNLETQIEVDGGINLDNSKMLKNEGVNILVAGTAIMDSKDYKYVIRNMK